MDSFAEIFDKKSGESHTFSRLLRSISDYIQRNIRNHTSADTAEKSRVSPKFSLEAKRCEKVANLREAK
jgi:hypothetical protein